MPMELHSKAALINAALMTRRPVAFLVGSPLSLKDGVGVPGITTMLDFVRAEIRDRAAIALPQFEATLIGKTGADAYQAAMKWLGVNAGQDAVNDVINKAVLQARKPGAGKLPKGADGDTDDWNIPSGTTGLAELVTRGGEKFLGPILTTNFDPLVSLAVRKSGGRAGRRVLTADGTLAGAAEDEPGISNVVHLHGFWRDSETLHTQAQLTSPRPKLKASLQRLLIAQQRTLIVAAYGGWDDVFTASLVELMNDEQAKLDVIWCFYENDPIKVEQKYGKLLHAVQPAIVLNRFRAFGGIDCHSIFTEILTTLQGTCPPAVVAASVLSPLAGWDRIDAAYLNALPALSQDEIVRYFDGAVPTWRHAISAAIPRRQDVGKLTARLAQVAHDNVARSMHLIRAAGGEGKSTLLLQIATDVARTSDWSVLWRTSPKQGISAEQISDLDPSCRWLIVADDADNLVLNLADSARGISDSNRKGVHFLLGARDADWKSAQGPRQPWAEWLDYFPDIVLRGITPNDAKVVLAAWENAGPNGLRELASIGDPAQRIATFESAVRDAVGNQEEQQRRHRPQEGSFFGGLLAVRFGQNGLQAHVRAFLQRLKTVPIEHGKGNLFDALLYVAACHGTGISGIEQRVLADLVGVPREWVQTHVVRPLGEEAAAVHSAEHVLTRHSQVAAAVLVEVEQTFGVDLAEVWAQLVRQTIRTSKEFLFGNWFSAIVHAGPRLQRALPPQLSEERRKAIAIAAAKADVAGEPDRLVAIVDLGKTYRNAGEYEQAAQVFRNNFTFAGSKVDHATTIRGYFYEWGVCEAMRGEKREHVLANVWLGGLSLSDHSTPFIITEYDVKLCFNGLGFAFGKLIKDGLPLEFAKARRASAHLGFETNPGHPHAKYFKDYERECDAIGTPHPKNNEEAITWLRAAVAQAGHEIQDPFLKKLLKPEQVSFNLLHQFLEAIEMPRIQRPQRKQFSPKPPVNAAYTSKPLRLNSTLEPRIQDGIDRVAREAWEVADSAATQDRLRIAKQEAIRIIGTLSPSIRKQVSHHYTSEKWQPLIARARKT